MDNHEHESEERGLPVEQVLTDTSDRRLALLGLGISAVAVVIMLVLFVWVDGTPRLAYLALGLAAAATAIAVSLKIRVWAAWSNPQLFLPSSEPLHLGDHVVVRVRRTARGSSDPAGMAMTAALRVQERAIYRLGSSIHVATEQVYDAPVGVTLNVFGRTVEADLEIDVPLYDVPPTMDLGNNEVHWELWIRMEAPNAPDDDTTFSLVVAPAVAERPQSGASGR